MKLKSDYDTTHSMYFIINHKFILFSVLITIFVICIVPLLTYIIFQEKQYEPLRAYFSILVNCYITSWIPISILCILVMYILHFAIFKKQFYPQKAIHLIINYGGLGGAIGFLIFAIIPFLPTTQIDAGLAYVISPNMLIDGTTLGAFIGAAFALLLCPLVCVDEDNSIFEKMIYDLFYIVLILIISKFISPKYFILKIKSIILHQSSWPILSLDDLYHINISDLHNYTWQSFINIFTDRANLELFDRQNYLLFTLIIVVIYVSLSIIKQYIILRINLNDK